MFRIFVLPALFASFALAEAFALTPEQIAKLPPPAAREVDFAKDIQPLLESSCIKCHAKGKAKGGLSIETRTAFLRGGDTGEAAVAGKSVDSLIVELVAGFDPDSVMPKKGKRWTPEEIGLLRAWIDQGMKWPDGITFAKPPPQNLFPTKVEIPAAAEAHPIDSLLEGYFAANHITPEPPVEDAVFARRVYLDLIGLLPTPEQLSVFLSDGTSDKRARLVRQLLSDNRGYADHWISFWNDLLRNDYKGTGFIDGGRKQISEWLYDALLTNKPYDRFVAELVDPTDKTEGFTAGIRWRGNVTAAMLPPMQAAQSVSQVFLGINLKCASCHDSFVSDWSLADAYGMAAVFSDGPLELVHCDKPTGEKASLRFLYPEIGKLDPQVDRGQRLKRLAELMTEPKNGRLARTIVNRLWERFFGRGLVEPIDDMEQKAWSPELLDWLASDLASHGYDLKRTLEVIATSHAYQLPAAEVPKEKEAFVFRGPQMRRLSAEQFSDAVSALADEWAKLPSTLEFDLSGGGPAGDFRMPQWIWTDEPLELAASRQAWRQAKVKAEIAQTKAAEAQKLVENNSPDAAVAENAAQAAAEAAAQAAKAAAESHVVSRHRVIFRKHLQLEAKPDVAYATIAVSQGYEVRVNGNEAKPKMVDEFYNARIRLYDVAPFLQAGENVISISVDSHTEKQMSDSERKQFPESAQHLNQVSGVAFYLRCRTGDAFSEWTSDDSWQVRRSPDGNWMDPKLADAGWAKTSLLPAGAEPIDEGPGLEPLRRKDFANQPAQLVRGLRSAVSTAALAGKERAALRAADPLQIAMDRPNREIVTPVRIGSPTTLQSLELTNGATLNGMLQRAGSRLTAKAAENPEAWVDDIYRHALSRPPTADEKQAVLEMLGTPVRPDGVADFLWAVTLLPEFQFID